MVEDRFASLIANASDVIMIVEPDGVLRFISPACERTLGFKPDEVARQEPARYLGRRRR